jgi:hypothetical protein
MPIVNVEGVGQVSFPDTMAPEEIKNAIERDILPQFPEILAKQSRTIGEMATDVVAPIGKGIGSLLQLPGQVAGLVTGRPDETTGLQGVGKRLEAFSEEAKSPALRAREALRSQKISQAEGFFDEAGTAIGQTLKDPALLSSFIFEQVPNLIGTMGGGLLTKGVVKTLMINTTEEAMKPVLAKAGVRGAIGTGAIMQGADIGTNTFENVYNELISQGVDQDTAMKEALSSGRTAAIQAGALTLGTSFGAGATIERALTRGMAGVPKAGIIRGTLGETLSEAVEEGGGQLASNIQLQQVAPETDIMKGVGAAAGLGAVGGALFGLPASFLNKANAVELERAKAQLEEAKRKAAETLQPQQVNLAIGYDPTVEGSGVYTPIIVNPDGTTIFPSERTQFAPTATSELSEEGFREKYGIASPEQIKDRTFDADRIRSFGISPKANLYKNQDILGADIANPQEAAKVKEALQDYLKRYPKANPAIRKNIEDYLARPEFQPLPVSETPTEITSATTTPEADAQAIRDRMIKGFRDRPEIKKIYEDYDKFMQTKDVDKAALSAFNKIVSTEVLKGLGINPVASIYQDQEVLNADLSVPENADRVRAKLMAFKDQSKSQKVKDNIDTYLNRTEFLTPQYIYDILNPPVEVEGKAAGQEQFVFIDPEGNIQSHYGTIVKRGNKRFAKYKDGERELTENVLVNPNPDQVEILELYKRKEKISKEPDEFKQWLMAHRIDSSERADIGLDKRMPNRYFKNGGFFLDDLLRIAIEQNIITAADVDLEGVDGGVSDFREIIRTSLDGGFVPTPKNIRVMMDLESIQNQIEYLENKLKGAPEEAIAEEFTEPSAPKKVEPKEELISKTVTIDNREIPITMNKTDERSGYSLVDVNVDAFEENFAKDKDFYVGPEGEGGIGKRYAIFTEFAKTAPSIEAPSVGIDENGNVMFDNGRHRYAYFRDQGLKTIPMSMSPESLANAKKFGYVGEKPKKPLTAKDVLAGMPAQEKAAREQSREGLTSNQNEVLDMADEIETAGEAGFANAMRMAVLNRRPIDQQGMDFYRSRRDEYVSRTGAIKSPIKEKFDIETFVEGYARDKKRLESQTDFFGTETSEIVEKSNDYIKRLAGRINDAGYKVADVNSLAPKEVQEYRRKISNIAGSTMQLMKQNEAIAKDYKRADQARYQKTVDELNQDFAEVDQLLGEEPQYAKATMEQKKDAEDLAKGVKGGEVVFQDGDIALIRGFSVLTGDPVYMPTKGKTRARVDVDTFNGTWINEADMKVLRKAKKDIETKAAKKHKENSFIQFNEAGIAVSKDIDPKLAGVISEWKKLFGLKGNLYVSTTEDAIANRDNFTGPYRRIQDATYNKDENGITQLLSNGDRYILFKKSTSISKMLETLAHEMGHAHQAEVYNNASPEIKKQLKDEHMKWLASQKGKSARDLLNSLRAKKTAETTRISKEDLKAEELDNYAAYWTSFSEWYADQVARWATTSEKPLSVVEKFFSKIANGLRKIFSVLKNKGYMPNETFKAYMDYITSKDNVRSNQIKPPTEEDQQPLFSKATMKGAFEGLTEDEKNLLRKQFVQEEATVGQKFENLKDNFFERFITGVFDEFRAIKKYSTEGYMMARLSKSIDGGLQGLLEHGQVYLKDGALDIRPNTKGLLAILEPLGTEVDQYQMWKALNRDARMPPDKRSFDDATIQLRDKLSQGKLNGKSRKELYDKALQEENQLNKSVLDIARQTGLIDNAAYQVFSNDIYYIPFYKQMEDGSVDAVNASSKLTGQYFSKALKGGEKKVNDLMENVLLNWSHILSASMKNQATNQTINDAESMGAAEKVKPMDGKYPPNTIKFMENGKTVHYALSDPDLVDAISTISYLGPKSAFLDIAKGFTNALRYGVTLSPAYKIRNLIRDSMSSAAVSELGPNMLDNVYNGLKMSRKGDPTFMAALAGGGIFEMGTAHEGDQAKMIKRLIDKGVKATTILDSPEKIKGMFQDLLNNYNELGNKFENANRLALYRKLRDSGKSHLEASFAARDLMDFSMQGQFRSIKIIASVVPFFNARLQGLYKLGRDGITPTSRWIYNATTGKETSLSDKQKAQRFMTMLSAITLASILLYGIYKDDEDFQRRESWDRDNFWWFKIGDVAFRIPKPFEIGALGTIAERTYEQLSDEGVEGKVFAERLNHILMDTFSLNPMPQMIKPLIDIYANKDSFTGAPIESAGMERLSKQERMTNRTSVIAQTLGGVSEGAAKILTFNPDAQGISPIQMDYFIKAYFGWLGATAASTADLAVEPFREGTRVRKPFIDTVAMGFIKTEPETQSKYMTQFYENNAKLQSALADMRHYAELGDMEKVTKIMEEKGDKIALSKVYDKATKQLAELRKQNRIIENSKDISTDDKRAEMNRIKILMSDIAKQMEDIRKSK